MRKGSALLIVLGMLSFMLFSGIAFSVYMRQTRLPSSFLRRTSVTRLLAKAALAEAISEIDAAIGNDPHPGVRRGSSNSNYWDHRIFTGQSTAYNGDTISTLTLEGLAYLPPSLINEARYYSRHTPTAGWHKFRFEAGRYAYTAIDVSDYFDVNRALADRPRSSAASRRVTLAHIFEKSGNGGLHGSQASGEAAAWDEWLEQDGKVRTVDDATDRITFNGKMPLVSLADFNLLMGKESFGLIKSPFVDYMDSPGGAFYPDAGDSIEDEQAEAYRSMTFVTDSHFRKPTTDEKDISSSANQPFDRSLMQKGGVKAFETVIGNAYDARSALWDNYYCTFLSRLGMCALCDYLDEDSIPVSLAIPTCERVPMLCAVRPKIEGAKLAIVKTGDPTKAAELLDGSGKGKPLAVGKTRSVSCWFTYQIDGSKLGTQTAVSLDVLALYPFLHKDGVSNSGYSVDGQMALFFTRNGEDVPLVTGNLNDILGVGDMTLDSAKFDSNQGVIRIPFGKGEKLIVSDTEPTIKKPQMRVQEFRSLATLLPVGGASVNSIYLLRVRRQWTQTNSEDEDRPAKWEPALPPDDAVIAESDCKFPIIDKNGNAVNDSKALLEYVKSGAQLNLNLALWLRVRSDKDGKVVDMAPAWMKDDQMNGVNWNTKFSREYYKFFGSGTHFLKYKFTFNGSESVLPLSFAELDKQPIRDLTLEAKTLVCADPRYNHSPYNWFSVSEDDVEQAWKNNCNCTGDGRDGDYYMATSDQGYLQSVYELAFMPRTTNPVIGSENLGADVRWGNLQTVDAYGRAVGHPGSFAACINAGNMWKTYRPFRIGNYAADDFDGLGFVSGLNGLMVNPYSDSPEVLAAAFANTPTDWHVASTNNIANPACDLGVDAFNKQYAWNAYGDSKTRLPWEAILDIADNFQAEMRNRNGSWEDVFRAMWENDGYDSQRIAGIDLSKLSASTSAKIQSVDRKFLYGFWHDCFAANQQLFLVFVRAEPMMMGGGVAGNAPPQLSSRAVALVWRNPSARKNKSGGSSGSDKSYIPHEMRILFYHPLD